MNGKSTVILVTLSINLAFDAQVFASDDSTKDFESNNQIQNNLEIGFEFNELAQNDFNDLGSSNYTFLIGQKFTKKSLDKWGWRFLSIKVDLSNDHLKNENEVCCIDGNRDNLVGKLNIQRIYFDYYPSAWVKKTNFKMEFIPSFAIGYNNWYLKETKANEDHDVEAYTIGGNFRLKFTFYDRLFVEVPNIDLGVIVHKNKDVNATIGEATINRPEYISFNLLATLGYKFTF
jgi:hypothetical protein